MPHIIDAHIHYADDDPGFIELLEALDLRLLNICFQADFEDDWHEQRTLYSASQKAYPNRFAWCTTFDLPHTEDLTFDRDSYVNGVLRSLDEDFDNGAVACKAWKNIGMSVRKEDGSFLMIDDDLFKPIFDHLAANDHTMLMHMAEPLACWQPLDERSPHFGYYSNHPQWHMYNHPEYPSHTELIAARDRMVAQHPDLRIVGAHLGSLEYDVDEVAVRLDRYPNFAVDTSARLGDMAMQDSSKVRDFVTKYQDRILFGTDMVMQQRPSTMPENERRAALEQLRDEYRIYFAYFETATPLTIRGIETVGLDMAHPVLDKLYRENALHWYPGLAE